MATSIMLVILVIYVIVGIKFAEYLERINLYKPTAITLFVLYVLAASSTIVVIGTNLWKYFEGI